MAAYEVTPFPKGLRRPKRIMQTFRLPPDLVAYLKREAPQYGIDRTAFVIRVLQAFRSDCGLPAGAVALLDADRAALALDRFEYLAHALFQRQFEIRDKEPGFDASLSRPTRKDARR